MAAWPDFLPTVLGSALGATVFGWLGAYFGGRGKVLAAQHDLERIKAQLEETTTVTKRIEQSFSRNLEEWRLELTYRQQQLAELYGPLYAMLKTQERLYPLWLKGELSEKNLEIKMLFKRQNEIARELLLAKAHLIEGSTMPPSFIAVSTSTIIFDLYAAATNDGQIPQHLKEPAAFPLEFQQHVYDVAEKLKKRLDEMHYRYAPPLELI